MNEISQFYLPASLGFAGCLTFIILRPNPYQQRIKIIVDIFSLIIVSIPCGIGAYLVSKAYLSKPEDVLVPLAVIPFFSGFAMPSILRGLTVILQNFQRAPLSVIKLIKESMSKPK